jgi:hypothetical protein
VLVWAEQGLGDAIQFARYASVLASLGARVILEVHPELVGALQGIEGVARVVPFGMCGEPCDFHCALMSLPHRLGPIQGYAIPSPGAYLRADPSRTAAWARRMDARPNVGLAWSGNPAHVMDFRRSVPLGALLEQLPEGIAWWCAQKEVREPDAQWLERDTRIRRPALGDFADTAAFLASLDAVVTVDTSVAHLAGALGRPTLLLLCEPADWRWQCHRTDTPWYGSMRLFRQAVPGEWATAIVPAMRHLSATLTARRAPNAEPVSAA